MRSQFICCALLILAPAVAAAQEPTNQQLLEGIQQLQEDIKAVKDLAGRVAANEQDIQSLNDRLDQLTTIMNSQDEELRQIVEAISKTDSDGQVVPDLLANMEKSSSFKQEVSQAVHQSLRTDGTFMVTNKTNSYQRIWVNRTEYGINAGQRLTLNNVPVGTVTTQLPGQKLENWTLAAPAYAQEIEIVPAETSLTTVYRPLASAYSPQVQYYGSSTYSYYTDYTEPLTYYYYRPWFYLP